VVGTSLSPEVQDRLISGKLQQANELGVGASGYGPNDVHIIPNPVTP
jgi:hypothetical protein